MTIQHCPDRKKLADFVRGQLSDEQSDEVAEHSVVCTECERVVPALESESDELLEALRGPAPDCRFAHEPECVESLALSKLIPNLPILGLVRDYELLEEIGSGGMGTVYKARHVRLDRVVALKMLPAARVSNQQAVQRFLREMKAVGKLDHVNIVRATDAGEADGTHYLVMDLVNGIDLSQLMEQNGPLPVPEACEIVRQVAVGLQHAHEHGLVHRDIKPSNVMLTPDGHVKILDLGLARLHDYVAEEEELTREGQTLGTLDYMAPEQLGDSRTVDVRADIYSMGATLYKLLCGKVPFAGLNDHTRFQKIRAILTAPVPPIEQCRSGNVPGELAALLNACLAKDTDQRPATPAEVADAQYNGLVTRW